jgi:hypothetical protein
MGRRAALRTVPAVACGVGLVVALAGPVAAQADPSGNNGTVKIDGVEFDSHPDNQPHVGCTFQVDFYGFDEGDLDATVTFEAVAPTVGGELVTDEIAIGEDAAGGGTDLDGAGTYDLTDALAAIEPHPLQGWHVRLTVHAEGSQGADTKFKEFWVSGCETTTPPEDPDEPGEPNEPGDPDEPEEPGDPDDPTPSSSVPIVPGDSDGPGPDTEIVPGTGTVPDAPSGSTTVPLETTSAGGDLPDTGANSLTLASAAFALIAVGSAVAIVARRARFGRED